MLIQQIRKLQLAKGRPMSGLGWYRDEYKKSALFLLERPIGELQVLDAGTTSWYWDDQLEHGRPACEEKTS